MSDPYNLLRTLTVVSPSISEGQCRQLRALLAERDKMEQTILIAGLTDLTDNTPNADCLDHTAAVGSEVVS